MRIVPYEEKYRTEFIELNTAWLTKLYYIESFDQYSMDHIDELIEKGSIAYFAVDDNDKVIATCMTEPLGNNVWEICKLAAVSQYTGTGAGSAVLKACMDYSINHGANKLCLITISGLKPAIHLYKKFGFKEVPYRKDIWHSEKADVEMEYIVDNSERRKK
jgi:ribosomal protein S18 acetylase RimI-like enzyme